MLRFGKGDVRWRLKERDGQFLIESVTYRKILCLRYGTIMGNGVRTKLAGDKVHEKQKVKKPKALKPSPRRDKQVQDSGFERDKNAQELDRGPIDLPDSYGETKAVLMAIEPYLLHVYWEVTSEELEKAKHWSGDDHAQSQAILRFYDVTNPIVDNGTPHSFFDMDIDLNSRSRYVHLWSPDKSYFVELGFKTGDGRFFPIVRSNVAQTPSAWPAPRADQREGAVHENPEEGLSKALTHEDHCVDPTIKTGNTQRQVRPQKVQEPRHQEKTAQNTDSAQTPPEGRIEQSGFQIEARPSFRPGAPLKEGVQASPEKGVDVDMTEMNEKEFALGISSEQGASSQRKNDSADG